MKIIALVISIAGFALANSMVQTDWSGGATGEITTTDWGSDFGSCFGMGWQTAEVLVLGTAMTGTSIYEDGTGYMLRTANINNDAYSDCFWCDFSCIAALLPTSNPNLWNFFGVGEANGIRTIFPGDLSGDGLDDVVGGQDSLFWWENPGNPAWDWQKRLVEKIYFMGGVAVDYDSDGDDDIICFHWDLGNDEGDLYLYSNLGDGLVWSRTTLYVHELAGGGGGPEMASAYITGDGKLSIAMLLAQEPASMIYVLREGSPDWYAFKVLSPPCVNLYRVFPSFVDLDTDGVADLMVGGQSYDYGRIRWYEGPEFYPYYNLETDDNVYGLATIDFDNDGDMDIIYRGEYTVGMFENTRSPQERFVQRVLMEYPFSNGLDIEGIGNLVAPGDFNGDGVEDFVCSFWDVSDYDFYWWRLGEDYCSSGWLNSDILYVYDASWGELTWEASVPAETQLYFQVRGSDDPTDLGEWSGLLTEPVDLSSYLADGESYLQYRVTMLSDNPSVSPQLNSVTVTYDPLGIEENPELRLSVSPSPATTTACVRLSLPESVDCTVSVYGLDGRLVERLHGGSLPAGESTFTWDASSVPSGVYFVRVAGSGVDSSARLAVVR